jgi:hypothetical protein
VIDVSDIVTAWGLTVAVGDRYYPVADSDGQRAAAQLDTLAKQAHADARAVWQYDGLSVIVWLPGDADAQYMRQHLHKHDHFVDSIACHYGPPFA